MAVDQWSEGPSRKVTLRADFALGAKPGYNGRDDSVVLGP